MSDHLAVLFNIDVAATRSFKPPHKVFIYYKKADFTKLNEFMSHASENVFLSSPQHNSVSENWFKFKLTLTKGIQDYVPHKKSMSVLQSHGTYHS
jgi:hypothetical protein